MPSGLRSSACLLVLLIAAAGLGSAAALTTVQLHSLPDWQLDDGLGFGNVSLEGARLPAAALQLLQEAGVIGDPLYRFGELDYRWAAWDNWTFSLDFDTPPLLRQEPSVLLHFGGLDTVSEITLNGALVGRTANAHRPHAFDVTRLLSPGRNQLSVTLFSAPAHSLAQQAAYSYSVPAVQQVGALPAYNFIRKAASDFGWDWGPAFAPAGITGPVELWGHSTALLTGVVVRQQHFGNGSVEFTADALLLPPPARAGDQPSAAGEAQQEEQGELVLVLTSPDGSQSWEARADVGIPAAEEPAGTAVGGTGASSSGGEAPGVRSCPWQEGTPAGPSAAQPAPAAVKRSLGVIVDQPELWWPHDFGSQPLYNLQLTYTPASPGGPPAAEGPVPPASSPAPEEPDPASSAASRQSLSRRVGLRLVELVTDALPGGGESFFFRANGLPLYARGANIVPAHVFETSESPAQLRRLVRDAKASHMNMLRVWGGGRYFADAFYDACDEEGVLVWQEAMFACAMYPTDAGFLREAWMEVSHQAARLSSHPSVVIWGGNNENEAAFTWFPETLANPRLYAVDFSRLFVEAVRQAVLSADPNITFVDTSPSKGLLSRHPYTKRWGDVAGTASGDIHFYDYSSDAFSPATYPPAKFVSEFGFMSLPSFAAYKQATAPEDWDVSAPMTAFRLRHASGLEELAAQMGRHFFQSQSQEQGQSQGQQGQGQGQGGASAGDQAAAAGSGGGPAVLQQLSSMPPDGAAAEDAPGGGADESPSGQRSSAGQQQAQQQAQQATPEPQFRSFTYLSKLQQGLAYQTAVQQWRRNKADPAAKTMGVLYWQLNDVWQGPSWSGVNSDGSWRLLHHLATDFFRPVMVSGVRAGADGDLLEVHLTNDLPVGVTGTLSIDAVPFNATGPEHVQPLYAFPGASVQALGSRLAWNASLSDFFTPAPAPAGDGSAQPGSGGSAPAGLFQRLQAWVARRSGIGQPSAAAASNQTGPAGMGAQLGAQDAFLRLRFCPTAIRPLLDGTGAALPNPFLNSSSVPAAAAGSAGAAAKQQLSLALGGGASAAERQVAAGDGSEGSPAGGSHAPPCQSPVAPPAGASEAQCAAARRLLQCSEALVFLTEFKDAAMQPANVSAELLPAPTDSTGSGLAGELLGPAPSFGVRLSSDAVALFVSVENEQQPGRLNGSGLLLLPWEPQTLAFFPTEAAVPGAGSGGSGVPSGPAPPQPEAEARVPAGEGSSTPAAGLPAPSSDNISVYWLQRELALLQPQPGPPSAAPLGMSAGAWRASALLAAAVAAALVL